MFEQSYQDMAEHMTDYGDSYIEMQKWAEETLKLPNKEHDACMRLMIQNAVEKKFEELPSHQQAWMRKHPEEELC